MNLLKSLKTILIHCIGIIIFLMIPFIFSPFPDGSGVFRDVFGYLLMVGFFYFNYYFLLPRFYFNEKYTTLIIATLISFAIIVFLPHVFFPFMGPESYGLPPGMGGMEAMRPMPPPHHYIFQEIVIQIGHNIFLFFVVVFVSMAIRINEQLKKTQQEKLNTELSYLKAQVNPHFLFNTLNSIYSLAIQDRSDDTADAVVKLSGMMRYVLHDTSHDFVSLEKEIEYISDFIDLQKLRWEDSNHIYFNISGDFRGWKIAPVILQPFIENAIKYGVNPDVQSSRVDINIMIGEHMLTLKVENTKVRTRNDSMNESGIGIENTTRRLDILYPGEYTLEKKEDAEHYVITLTLTNK